MSEGEKHPGEAGRGKKEENRPRRRLRLRREDSAASAWLFGHLTQRVRSRAPLETASAGGGMWGQERRRDRHLGGLRCSSSHLSSHPRS